MLNSDKIYALCIKIEAKKETQRTVRFFYKVENRPRVLLSDIGRMLDTLGTSDSTRTVLNNDALTVVDIIVTDYCGRQL